MGSHLVNSLVPVAVLVATSALAQPMCPGDFDGDVRVTIDEVLTSVNHALESCPVRFVDNRNGTITDTWTRLVWEKKSDDDGIHDKDNRYTWCVDNDEDDSCASSGNPPDGTTFTEFLATLNRDAFAGHSDWRIPTLGELQAISDYALSNPALDVHFYNNCLQGCTVTQCSCTALNTVDIIYYWTSTTFVDPRFAWMVGSDIGDLAFDPKKVSHHVRAVRNLNPSQPDTD